MFSFLGKPSGTAPDNPAPTLGMDALALARAAKEAQRAASAETSGSDRRARATGDTIVMPGGLKASSLFGSTTSLPPHPLEESKLQEKAETYQHDDGLDLSYDSSVLEASPSGAEADEDDVADTFAHQSEAAAGHAMFPDRTASDGTTTASRSSAPPKTVYTVAEIPGATFHSPEAANAAQAAMNRLLTAPAARPGSSSSTGTLLSPPPTPARTVTLPAATSGYTGPTVSSAHSGTDTATTPSFAYGPATPVYHNPYGGTHFGATGFPGNFGAFPTPHAGMYTYGPLASGTTGWFGAPPALARENLKNKLAENERTYRARKNPAWAACADDGRSVLHPYRLAPQAHINPERLFQLGLDFAGQDAAPPLPHDISHVRAGTMVDARAYILAASLQEPVLDLSKFRPGTFSDPQADRPLANMRDTLRAWAIYKMLVRRSRPWDLSNEVVSDFVYETEMFASTEQAYGGYYRAKDHPPYKAILELVQACHSSLVRMLAIQPAMLSLDKVEAIHRQRCAESPSAWLTTHPSLRQDAARGARLDSNRETKRSKKQHPKATAAAKADTKRIKEICRNSAVPSCQAFALAVQCPRKMNAAGTHCLFTRTGLPATELAHTCPFLDASGNRCNAAHAMSSAH